jgi:FtsP/CotA-like multicopper oxidase with cupredoxin domain
MKTDFISRRQMLGCSAALGLLASLERLVPSYVLGAANAVARETLPGLSGSVIDLTIAETPFRVGNRTGTAKTINGTLPGPLIRTQDDL